MGLFGKGNKARDRHHHTAIVAEGTKFRGELTLEVKLHIDGRVEGAIRSTEDVSVGRNGHVEADVTARNMVVCGYLKGNVECDRIEITASGTLIGGVLSNAFVVESGARFDGENHIRSPQKPDAPRHRSDPIPLQARLARDKGD